MKNDPQNSPLVRHVLNTNDMTRLLSGYIMGMLSVARPERVKAALESILANWDERVKTTKAFYAAAAAAQGETSGWEDS